MSMREFKFRAWDKEKNISANWKSYDNMFYFMDKYTGVWIRDDEFKRFTLMQYTGLKDKDDTEIYEGDIIENNEDGLDGPIEWKDNGWKIKGTIERRYEEETWLEIKYVEIQSEPDDKRWGLKVIGNIFENPELLGGI